MSRAHRGDQQAYAQLMTELGDAIEAYVRHRFGALDGLEDCVQEALLAVHRARHTYDDRRPFRPWLFTIVRHKTIDHLRRAETRGRNERPEASPDDWAGGPARNPADGVDAARLLAQLDPRQREALELTRYAGYSLAEAAEKTGVSMTAMKTRVHRAIRNVRRLLEAEGPTP